MHPIIETQHCTLREFTEKDTEAVYEFGSNAQVNKYTGDKSISTLSQAKEIITDIYCADYKKYGYGRWAVVYKPENKIIGFAGLKYLPELQETDIGFRLLPQYWGKGIATETSRKIIPYGFEKLKLKKIIGIAMPENKGSCKVLEKIGLKLYKTSDYNGVGNTYHWYQLKREDYQNKVYI